MKFSQQNYRRDTVVDLLRRYTGIRKVRGTREGVFYECHTGEGWVRKKLDNSSIDKMIMELYG